MSTPTSPDEANKISISEIALGFLKLGIIGFGGPAAHIALMQREFVEKRKWLTEQAYLDLISAANLIPGPSSTEVALYLGFRLRRFLGLFVAGFCFISPAFISTTLLAVLYVELGQLPNFEKYIFGIQPAVLAVIVGALWKLTEKAIKGNATRVIAILVIALVLAKPLLGVNELAVLLIAGLGGMLFFGFTRQPEPPPDKTAKLLKWVPWLGFGLASRSSRTAVAASTQVATGVVAASSVTTLPTILKLSLFFLKVGAILYGSGYVLIAYLQGDLVDHYQWLSYQQLLDSVAIGQFTPGPIFTTASFIGYLVIASEWGMWWGLLGAFTCTVAIFIPAFLLVPLSEPIIPKLRSNRWTAAFLDSVNAASLGLMAAVTINFVWNLWFVPKESLSTNIFAFALSVVALVGLFKFKVNSMWLIFGGAAAGVLWFYIESLVI